MDTRLHAQPKAAPPPSFTPVRGGVLQRKCACGGKPSGAHDECDECSRRRLTVQRQAKGSSETHSVLGHSFGSVPVNASEKGIIQTKLALSELGDDLEQEADRVASTIMRMPEADARTATSSLSQVPGTGSQPISPRSQESMCLRQVDQGTQSEDKDVDLEEIDEETETEGESFEDQDGESIQAKEVPGRIAPLGSDIGPRLKTLRGRGQPLPSSARAFFDPRFGFDFKRVRIHTDSSGAELARSLNARAFTSGNDIVFGATEFAPETAKGKELLAHELTHVVQQDAGGSELGTKLQLKDAPKKKPKTKPKTKEVKKAPADKERTKWRLHYKTKDEVQDKFKVIKELGLDPEEPFAEDEGWTFFYFPRTKEGAQADAVAKQKELGDKHTVTAESSPLAKSWFVKVILKCPEGIPEKKGFHVWAKCFSKQKEADALVKKFKGAHINAESVPLPEVQKFGVYYQPLMEKEASTAGKAEAEKRPGFAEGMYTVKTSQIKELDSFTYSVSTACPTGFTDLGGFKLTAYVFALESEFPEEPKVKDPCGLKGEFNRDFLFKTSGAAPLGVKMEGSGLTRGGKIVQFERKDGKDCFRFADCAETASRKCAEVGRTVAVDKAVIPLGTELLIEDVGHRVAEDTGEKITRKHIDVYYGKIDSKEANKRTLFNKKVCKKKGKK